LIHAEGSPLLPRMGGVTIDGCRNVRLRMATIVLCVLTSCELRHTQDGQEIPMEGLIRELQSDEHSRRASARSRIISEWKRWGEADLRLLETCATGQDADLRSHSIAILHAVRIRHSLGEEVIGEIPRLDQLLLSEEDKTSVLLTACRKYASRQLLTRSLDKLAQHSLTWELSASSKLKVSSFTCRFRVFPFRRFALSWLASNEESVRVSALEMLTTVGTREDASKIVGALEDSSSQCQLKACRALAHLSSLDSMAAISVIRYLARVKAPEHQIAALEVVRVHRLQEAKEIVLSLLESGHPEVVNTAVRICIELRYPVEVDRLAKLLKHVNQGVAEMAVQYSAKCPVKGLLKQLIRVLEIAPDDEWRRIVPLFVIQSKTEGFDEVLPLALGEKRMPTVRLSSLIHELELNEETLRILSASGAAAMRAAAFQEVGARRLTRLIQIVRGGLTDSDANVRGCAARALNVLGALTQNEFEQLFKDKSAIVRLAVAEVANGSPHTFDVRILVEDPEKEVRKAAIAFVATLPREQRRVPTKRLLEDPESSIKLGALELVEGDQELGALVDGTIRKLLSDSDESVLAATAIALPKVSRDDLGAWLFPLLRHPSAKVRSAAQQGLKSRPGWIAKDILPMLRADSKEVVLCAIEVTPYAQPTETLEEELGNLLSHASPEIRASTLYALLTSRLSRHAELARKLLHDEDAQVQMAAVRFLAGIGDTASRREISDLIASPDVSIRWEALDAISALGPKEHLPNVLALLRSDHPGDRQRGVSILGTDPKPFLNQIRALLGREDEEPNVVDAALRVLSSLDPDEVWTDFARWISSPVDGIRHQAIEMLARAKSESCMGWLGDLNSSDPDERVRASAAIALWAGGQVSTERAKQTTAEAIYRLGTGEAFFANALLNRASAPKLALVTAKRLRLESELGKVSDLVRLMQNQGLRVASFEPDKTLDLGSRGEETTIEGLLLRVYSTHGLVPVFQLDAIQFVPIERALFARIQ
jgi:HEAT repeat protein